MQQQPLGHYQSQDHGHTQRPSGGIGCLWWAVILGLGGCTVAACATAPEIGWTGWAVIIGAYLLARHLEQQREIQLAILEEMQRRNGYDDRYY